ncbi:hypothetical protein PACG_01670 [Pseudomonas aeruginosa C3719]|nr:hypothetical protein PACG_01670 [Pseudomonas aeruginosa C3719]
MTPATNQFARRGVPERTRRISPNGKCLAASGHRWSIVIGTHTARRWNVPYGLSGNRPVRPGQAHRERVPRGRHADLRLGPRLSDAVLAISVPAGADHPRRLLAPTGVLRLAARAGGVAAAARGDGSGQPGDRPVAAAERRPAVDRYRGGAVDLLGGHPLDDDRAQRRLRREGEPPGMEALLPVDPLHPRHRPVVAGGGRPDGHRAAGDRLDRRPGRSGTVPGDALDLAALASCGVPADARGGAVLLSGAGCRAAFPLHHSRLGALGDRLDRRVPRLWLLREELRQLQRHVRQHRGDHHPPAVLLPVGGSGAVRRRAERGDRTPFGRRQGPWRARTSGQRRPRTQGLSRASASLTLALPVARRYRHSSRPWRPCMCGCG